MSTTIRVQFLHLLENKGEIARKSPLCEKVWVFGYGFDVLWCHRIIIGIYIYIYIFYCLWDLALLLTYFLIFIEILVHALLYLFTEEKHSSNFDQRTVLYYFVVHQWPHLWSKILREISTIRGLFRWLSCIAFIVSIKCYTLYLIDWLLNLDTSWS